MSLRLDGMLDPGDIARLDDHLHRCSACAAQWGALREADQLLRVTARRPLVPAPDFAARVMAQVAVTPVARPQLWERERQQIAGGRRTVRLHPTGPFAGGPVTLPAGTGALPAPAHRLTAGPPPAHSLPIAAYLAGISVAGALSVCLLVVVSALWTTGLLPVPPVFDVLVGGNVEAARGWLADLWAVLTGLAAHLDPWVSLAATLGVVALGTAWWRIVAVFARRVERRRLIA